MSQLDLRAQLQSTLGDAYSIERELGGGGMSRVFLAQETSLGRPVVLKTLSADLAASVSADRFAREVRLAARLQQANIVPLLSTGEMNGVPWYSMPYVSGESLRAKLASGVPLSLTEAVHILRDVARALAFAHDAGVVHRDIKPENILLSGGAAVVTDFGIAKAVSVSRTDDGSSAATLTQGGATIGTPAYMAPEQIAGDPLIDHRADIYAWGVLAWELIANKHPFAGRSTAAMLAAHLSEKPAVLATVRADVSPTLATLIARCLEKEAAHRPQSATALLAALDQIGTASGDGGAVQASSALLRWVGVLAAAVVVVAAMGWFLVQRFGGPATAGEKSLAVLPFESVGGDTANAYFAEGIADELTTALTKVSGLRVAATSSAFSYRNKTADAREVGRALNVGAVLQGRIRREGARMRVSAQLSSAADGRVLWSNIYEREVKDAFAVQDELTRDIVGALRVTLAAGDEATPSRARRDTTYVETYDLYLRGLFFLQQRGGGVARSIDYFRRAVERDSGFARAWAELGRAYTVLPLFTPVPVDSVVRLAQPALANAQRLDPTSAAAQAGLGFALLLKSSWTEAAAAFEQALRFDSTDVQANRAYMSPLYQTGRVNAAVTQAMRAIRVDPLSATTHAVALTLFLNANRRADAVAAGRRGIELDSSRAGFAHLAYAMAMHASGDVDTTRKLLVGARPVPQTSPWFGYLLAANESEAPQMSSVFCNECPIRQRFSSTSTAAT